MHDEWSKKLSGGRIAEYTLDITSGIGGVITRKIGDIALTAAVKEPMTRAQVEAEFRKDDPQSAIHSILRILIYALIFILFLMLILAGYMRFFHRQFPR